MKHLKIITKKQLKIQYYWARKLNESGYLYITIPGELKMLL